MPDPGLSDLSYSFLMAEWKIERAKEHINYVETIIRWMTDPSNYVVRPDHNAQSGQYQLSIGPREGGLPRQLPIAIGDAVHNLASVLDYLWNALERQANPLNVNHRANFPRHETRENLIHELAKKTAVKHAFPNVEALILNVVKPYKTGNFPLWVLSKLDNIDKHRLLLTTYSIARFGKFVATSEDGGVIDLSGSSIQTDGPAFTLGFASPFKLNDDAEIVAEIVFGETLLPPGQPVLQTLISFVDAASGTVEAFRNAFSHSSTS